MKAFIGILFLYLLLGFKPSEALTCDSIPSQSSNLTTNSATANPITLEFQSGARWELCWHVDDQSGLILSQLHYGGPTMPVRKIMDSASIAQIVFQYDEDTNATHLVSEYGLGGEHWDDNALNCPDGEKILGSQHNICVKQRELNLLARARHYRSLPRNEFTLQATSTIGLEKFIQLWHFSEDGELKPAVIYSGKVSRYTTNASFGSKVDNSGRFASNATLLVNWRLDFNIDDSPNNDVVDEFNFLSESSSDLKKRMTTTPISTESFRKINNTDFRGWRISDQDISSGENGLESPTRIGYYLDPQPSGYRLTSDNAAWTEFDFAVTNFKECETLASLNTISNQQCGANLNDFVNGEQVNDPVVWFSLTRHFTPSKEDFPAIRSNRIAFSLIPFDWSASSPFSSLATRVNDSLGLTQ